MKLYLIRHSKTQKDFSVAPEYWNLSEEGVAQAIELAKDPIWATITTVYCSEQTKAIETGLQVAKMHHKKLLIDGGFNEISSFTKGTFADYNTAVHDFYEVRDKTYFEGETLKQALERFNKTLNKLRKATPDKANIAIVSHNNVLTAFIKQYLSDKSYLEIHDTMPMPSYAVIDLENNKLVKYFI